MEYISYPCVVSGWVGDPDPLDVKTGRLQSYEFATRTSLATTVLTDH